ncbi:MAG: cyclic nucleotide-binding domain-containing protein [Thermodesulfobacteriota bacterium]
MREDFLAGAGSSFLDEDERREILSLCDEKQLAAEQLLFDYQEPGETVYFLMDGRLGVHKLTGFQEKMQVIALLDPGAVVGEAALFGGHVRRTRVTAIEESRLLCLERKKIVGLQESSPQTAFHLVEYFFHVTHLRLEKTSERLARIL